MSSLGRYSSNLILLKIIKNKRGVVLGYVVGAKEDTFIGRFGSSINDVLSKGNTAILSFSDMLYTLSLAEYCGFCKSKTNRVVFSPYSKSLAYLGPKGGKLIINDLEVVYIGSGKLSKSIEDFLEVSYKNYKLLNK